MDSTEKKRIVVVLGMHRSGTSAIARALQVMGVGLGDRMMPPFEGNNAKGFWEDIDLNALNIEILNAIGSDWRYVAAIEPGDVEILRKQGYFLRAVELLRQKVGKLSIFGFKDPRVAKLLPFWKDVFSHCQLDVSCVLTVRHPLSVARSLAKRDDIEAAQSHLLWLGHVIASLTGSAGNKRVLVDYDCLMQSPEHELNRIARHLDLEIDPAELQSYKAEFLDQGLRHTVYDLNDLSLDDVCPPIVREVYTDLLDVASEKTKLDGLELQNKLVGWSDEFKRLRSPLLLVDKLLAQKALATQAVVERDGQIGSLNQTVSERDGQIGSLNQTVSERDGRIADLNQTAANLTQALTEREVQISSLNQSVVEYHGQIANLNQAVVEREGQIGSLNQAISELEGQIAALNQAVDERDRQIGVYIAERNHIFNSTSWRITKPLRFFRHSLMNKPYHFMRRIVSDGARQAWLNSPVSNRHKQLFKHKLFSNLPYLFRWTQAYRSWYAMNAPSDVTHDSFAEKTIPPASSLATIAYVPLLHALPPKNLPVRLIAFYLPQFHAIAENNAWWGEGFTEWTNVKPAQPQFEGHYQPRIPGELGYYDLLDPAVQHRQIELAKLYGVGGFCFYSYWFGGKLLLEKPVENYLKDRSLDLPFCLCWANENWSRRWDGLDSEILIEQKHSPEDDLRFIQYVAQYMRDERYIRIDGKPLLLVYRPSLLPTAKETAKRWRQWCQQNGIGDIFLAYTQSFEAVDPCKYGFDAAIEFPPNNSSPPNITDKVKPLRGRFGCSVYDWQFLVGRSRNYQEPSYRLFRGVCPSWDNTARRKDKGTVLLNSSPQGYQEWLTHAIVETCTRIGNPEERLIFANAWNEWAEGAYLEPDQRYGYAYLEATRMAMTRRSLTMAERPIADAQVVAIVVHAFYEEILVEIIEYLNNIVAIPLKLYVTTTPEKEERVRKLLSSQPYDFLLRVVENRGRDILPFMKMMPDVVSAGHDFFVKIHTKKSPHREDGNEWRKDMYGKLIDDAAIADAIRFLKENPRVGILSPDGHLVEMGYFWGSNAERVTHLASRMGVESEALANLNFIAGSMFVARVDAIIPLLNLAIDDSDFEPELGQTDGTLAHAIERLFSVSAHSIELYTTCPSNVALTEYKFVNP